MGNPQSDLALILQDFKLNGGVRLDIPDLTHQFEAVLKKFVYSHRTVTSEVYPCTEGHIHRDIKITDIFCRAADVAKSKGPSVEKTIEQIKQEANEDPGVDAGMLLNCASARSSHVGTKKGNDVTDESSIKMVANILLIHQTYEDKFSDPRDRMVICRHQLLPSDKLIPKQNEGNSFPVTDIDDMKSAFN